MSDAPVTTPNIGLIKSDVLGSEDVWGDQLNQNADTLDAVIGALQTADTGFLKLSGGTMTGALTLAADPAAAAQAATKGYVDAGDAANAGVANAAVKRAGDTMTGALTLPGNPAQPLQAATKQYVDKFLPLAGGTLSGQVINTRPFTIDFNSSSNSYASFGFWDTLSASGFGFFAYTSTLLAIASINSAGIAQNPGVRFDTSTNSISVPGGVLLGGLNSDPLSAVGGIEFYPGFGGFGVTAGTLNYNWTGKHQFLQGGTPIMYIDSGGLHMQTPLTLSGPPSANLHAASKQYVDSQVSSVSGIVEAPQDGLVYGRSNANWTAVVANNNIGRNLLHNPLFNVAQRGAGPFTTFAAYTLDRWFMNGNLDTAAVYQAPASDFDRSSAGDEAVAFLLQNVFTGNSGAAAFTNITHYIEDVRRLSGKTVTVSFWARSAAGTPKLGINMYQSFGTGGSPSAGNWTQATGASVTLSSAWTRFTVSLVIPSIAGKTLGTNRNHNTALVFGFSSGATDSAHYGNIGVQSASIVLWGVQLEIGSVATPLEKPDPRYDLANCQRFYHVGSVKHYGYAGAGNISDYLQSLPVTMRATPTITPNFTTQTNATGTVGVLGNYGQTVVDVIATVTASGAFGIQGTFTASAEL